MIFAERVMLRGLLENTCVAWWNTPWDGIVKLCVAVSVNPMPLTSLSKPPTYSAWLRMLKMRASNRNLAFSLKVTDLAKVTSKLFVGLRRSVLRPAVPRPPFGAVT